MEALHLRIHPFNKMLGEGYAYKIYNHIPAMHVEYSLVNLFICIHYLSNTSKILNCIIFADIASIFASHKNKKELLEIINNEISHVS